jgi:hypothetical protein
MEQWIHQHQMIVNIVATLVVFILGWSLPNDKVMAAGMLFSSFLRKIGGKKLEEKIENIEQAFVDGQKKD